MFKFANVSALLDSSTNVETTNLTFIYELLPPLLTLFPDSNQPLLDVPDQLAVHNLSSSFLHSFFKHVQLRERLVRVLSRHQQQQQPLSSSSSSYAEANESAVVVYITNEIRLAHIALLRAQFCMSMPMRAEFQCVYATIFVIAVVGNCVVLIVYRVAARGGKTFQCFTSIWHVRIYCWPLFVGHSLHNKF